MDVRHRKLLRACAYIEGRGHSEARTAVKTLAGIRERGKSVSNLCGMALTIPTWSFSR